MTTILGIKTNSGPDAVVLSADMQLNRYNPEEELIEKESATKIYLGKNWAMAYMGDSDKKIDSFFRFLSREKAHTYEKFIRTLTKSNEQFDQLDPRRIISEKIKIRARDIKRGRLADDEMGKFEKLFAEFLRKEYEPCGELEREILEQMKAFAEPAINPVEVALRRKLFFEVILLNAYSRADDVDGSDEFLLATNIQIDEKPVELYRVDCFGKLIPVQQREDDFRFICGGSGSEYVKTFFEKEMQNLSFHKQLIDIEQITIQEAMFLADKAMEKASTDIHTGETYSMVVVTENGIDTIDILSKDRKSHENNLDEEMKKYQQ